MSETNWCPCKREDGDNIAYCIEHIKATFLVGMMVGLVIEMSIVLLLK